MTVEATAETGIVVGTGGRGVGIPVHHVGRFLEPAAGFRLQLLIPLFQFDEAAAARGQLFRACPAVGLLEAFHGQAAYSQDFKGPIKVVSLKGGLQFSG